MPRQTLTKNYINDDELNRQIGEFADTTRVEHYEKVIAEQKQVYQDLSDSYDAGQMTKEEAEQLALMHKINQTFTHTPHEERWAQQNSLALEAKKIDEKMLALADKLRAKKIDDATYYERWGKLKVKRDALEKAL